MKGMEQGVSGGCFCGKIKFVATSAPRFAYHCHCSDCRRINGTAFHTGVVVNSADFRVTQGEPATFVCQADSGHTITRWHCADCGTQLFSVTTADPTITSLKAGALTSVPHEDIEPTLQIFWESRVHWADAPKSLKTYAAGMRGQTPLTPDQL